MTYLFVCTQGHHWRGGHALFSAPSEPPCPVCGAPSEQRAPNEPPTVALAEQPVPLPDGQPDPTLAPDDPLAVTPALERLRAAGYEILGELGRGGMGVVYKARQIGLNRIVALKMVLAGAHASAAVRRSFHHEAEAVALLRHPNIVQVYEVGEQDGCPYFSLEFVDGGNLDKFLNGAPLPSRPAAELTATLARAVHAAHQAGIIHRDLKPANVLLQISSEQSAIGNLQSAIPKITDFGLAKRLEQETGQTRTGAVVGTPSYIAPEQAAGRPVGAAVDVYSLGAILYEMLTGRPPFRGETPMETMLQVMSDEPVPPTRLHPRLPRDLETICLKCLHKDPRKRYLSAAELGDDLHRFLQGEPIRARPIGLVGRGLKWARRRPALAALGLVTALAGLSLLVGSLWYNALLQTETRRANRNAEETDRQRAEAVHQRELALEQEKYATGQALLARQQLEHSRRSLYALQLTQVAGVWQRDPRRVLELLEDTTRCPFNLQDFTWAYLYGLGQRRERIVDGHTKPVSAVAFAPDGRTLATASWDGTIRLHPQGEMSRLLRGHTGLVLAVAFTADGKTLASASEDRTIKLWDVATGAERASLDEPGGWDKALAFAPDGRTLASAGTDGIVRLWDMEMKQVRHQLRGHVGPVTGVAFAPDGQTLASAGQDRTVRLWDVATARKLADLTGHKDGLTTVVFAPDGRTVASGSNDGTVKLWETQTHELRATLIEHFSPVYCVGFAPNGKALASGSSDGVVKLWHPLSGEERCTWQAHSSTVLCLAFAPTGDQLATGSASTADNVKLWNVRFSPESQSQKLETRPGLAVSDADGLRLATALEANQVQIATLEPAGRPPLTLQRDPLKVRALAFSANGQRVVTGEVDGQVTLWDAANGQEVRVFQGRHTGAVQAVVFVNDGLVATGGADKRICLWDAATGQLRQTLTGHEGAINVLAAAPRSTLLVSAGDDATVRVWDLEATGSEPLTLRGHTLPVRCLAFAPGGAMLASGGGNPRQPAAAGELKVWDVASGSERLTLSGHSWAVQALAFTADGRTLASGGEDRTIRLWDPVGGQERAVLPGHTQGIHYLQFVNKDGALLSAAGDGTVKLWRANGPPTALLWQHMAGVTSLSLAADGETLASASSDGILKLGTCSTGQERVAVKAHTEGVTAIAFAPGQALLATAAFDGSVKIWQTATMQETAALKGHDKTTWSLAFAPDGRTLASAGEDRTVRLWDVATGQETASLAGHQAAVLAVAFAPDGQTLASGDAAGVVLLWDVAQQKVRATLKMHIGGVRALAFAPDGRTLASGGLDRLIQLWDAASGAPGPGLRQHAQVIYALAFAPRGRLLASVGGDPREALHRPGEVVLWDLDNRDVRPLPHGIDGIVTSVAFGPDERMIYLGGSDKTVRVGRY